MKTLITTLVIVEDIHDPQCDEMSICYHSFKEDPEEAKSELISEVNALYAPSIVFNSIEEINRDPSLNHPTNTLRKKQRSPNQNQRDNIQ